MGAARESCALRARNARACAAAPRGGRTLRRVLRCGVTAQPALRFTTPECGERLGRAVRGADATAVRRRVRLLPYSAHSAPRILGRRRGRVRAMQGDGGDSDEAAPLPYTAAAAPRRFREDCVVRCHVQGCTAVMRPGQAGVRCSNLRYRRVAPRP